MDRNKAHPMAHCEISGLWRQEKLYKLPEIKIKVTYKRPEMRITWDFLRIRLKLEYDRKCLQFWRENIF